MQKKFSAELICAADIFLCVFIAKNKKIIYCHSIVPKDIQLKKFLTYILFLLRHA